MVVIGSLGVFDNVILVSYVMLCYVGLLVCLIAHLCVSE